MYVAVYEHDAATGAWAVFLHRDGDRIGGVQSWGKTLREAAVHIREAAQLWFEASVEIVDDWGSAFPVIGDDVTDLARLRESVSTMQEELQQRQQVVAAHLADQGVSTRDAALVLGLSHQRVSQLASQKS